MSEPTMSHPEELLAEFVEDALDPPERALVDAHLASCARCREEVELARSAMLALRGLEEVPVPLGVTGPALRSVRTERPWLSRAARPVALAAAAAVIAVFGFVAIRSVGGRNDARSPEGDPAPTSADMQSTAGAESAPAVPVEVRDRDYDEAAVQALASELASSAVVRADDGSASGPPEASALFDSSEALSCIAEGADLDGRDQARLVIDARFHGREAWFGAFARSPVQGGDPDLLSIWVVSKDGCQFLHYAQQRL